MTDEWLKTSTYSTFSRSRLVTIIILLTLLSDYITFVQNEMCVWTSKFCKCFGSNKTNISNFHPLEVVGRGSGTQLQVGEKSNYLIQRFKDQADLSFISFSSTTFRELRQQFGACRGWRWYKWEVYAMLSFIIDQCILYSVYIQQMQNVEPLNLILAQAPSSTLK